MSINDDELLSSEIQASITADPGLRPYGIKVSSRKGIVLLEGIVDVLAEKMRAGEIASCVQGVTGIENNLTISTDGKITDSDVNFEVSEELRLAPDVDISKVYGESKKGVVHLKGDVDSPAEAKAAIWATAKARGVKDIVSHITGSGNVGTDTEPIAPRAEPTLPEQAAMKFLDSLGEYQASLPRPVSASVKDGVIIVEGEVATLEQKNAIEKKMRNIVRQYGRRIGRIDNRITLDTR